MDLETCWMWMKPKIEFLGFLPSLIRDFREKVHLQQHIRRRIYIYCILGGGFDFLFFLHLPGEMIQVGYIYIYVSNGFGKPPTRYSHTFPCPDRCPQFVPFSFRIQGELVQSTMEASQVADSKQNCLKPLCIILYVYRYIIFVYLETHQNPNLTLFFWDSYSQKLRVNLKSLWL